jgi:hypothetical protein
LDGAPCDGAITVSREAAVCIVQQRNELTTLEGPYVELGYDETFHKPVWNVMTVTSTGSAQTNRGGAGYTVDATNGDYLDSFGWSVVQ